MGDRGELVFGDGDARADRDGAVRRRGRRHDPARRRHRTLAAVHFASVFPTAGYMIAGGTLVLGQVTNDASAGFPENIIAANVSAAGPALTLACNGGSLDVTGTVTATDTLRSPARGPSSSSASNAIAGVQVADGATLAAGHEPGRSAGGGSTVTMGDAASLLAYTAVPSATFANGVTLAGPSATLVRVRGRHRRVSRPRRAPRRGRRHVRRLRDRQRRDAGVLLRPAFRRRHLLHRLAKRIPPPRPGDADGAGRRDQRRRRATPPAGAGSYTGGTSVYGSSTVELLADGAVGTAARPASSRTACSR